MMSFSASPSSSLVRCAMVFHMHANVTTAEHVATNLYML